VAIPLGPWLLSWTLSPADISCQPVSVGGNPPGPMSILK